LLKSLLAGGSRFVLCCLLQSCYQDKNASQSQSSAPNDSKEDAFLVLEGNIPAPEKKQVATVSSEEELERLFAKCDELYKDGISKLNCKERARKGEVLSDKRSGIPIDAEGNALPSASKLGTWLKSKPAASKELQPNEICFLGNGRFALLKHLRLPDGADHADVELKLQPSDCAFSKGFVFADHVKESSSADGGASRVANLLADDVKNRTVGFDGKRCTRFGKSQNDWLKNCWSCVGGSITDVTGWFDIGGDGTPNSFVTILRARYGGGRPLKDGVITFGKRKWRIITHKYRKNPGSAPRGSLVLCNTSAAGHSTIVLEPNKMARSDVTEVPAEAACHSGNLHEIMYPLD
jgi:hypothetical protein